jgi:septum formation protein
MSRNGDAAERLILGSASERRRKILAALGVAFEVLVPEVGEEFFETDPRLTARVNAEHKSRWCRARRPDRRVLTADTVVAFEGRCVTKPRSPEEAGDFLRMFSGRTQAVYTAAAFARPGLPGLTQVVESEVRFRVLTDDLIAEYLRRVDPMDKAGAYDIDQHGDLIIESFGGSRTNIMGLPEESVCAWLRMA